jgi:glycosyltransferase involved in cell wall biosynthesis
MHVLLYSPAFFPSVGGLESFVAMLARQLHEAGDTVTVVCTTAPAGPEPFPFEVVRSPGPLELLRRVRACEVFLQANVSLKGLWPLLLVRRPWVVSHHSWYRQGDGRRTWRDRLKRSLLSRAAASIAVSRAVADDLEVPSVVLENPYRDDLFRCLPEVERDRELVFVGRLVSDKGCDLLVEALARLRRRGAAPRLTVVGAGPERERLERMAAEATLPGQVELTGVLSGERLVEILNRHRILVVPSRYNEPFGIVALEGLACGCAVIGSRGGGLSDAIGPGGWTFPNRDVDALTDLLERALAGRLPAPDPAAVEEHLGRHTCRAVAAAYRQVLASARAPARTARPASRP